MKILVLAALAALTSGCWNGVQVSDGGKIKHSIEVGDMSCVSCEYEITSSNAVITVVFVKDPGR